MIFGGVGSGLYGMLVFAVIAIFIAGLMVGRTPEYLGKKIEAYDVKMAMLALLVMPLVILGFVSGGARDRCWLAKPAQLRAARAYRGALRLHFGAGNNGCAFAGISANMPFYNVTLGIAMFVGRFILILPVLALAGSLAAKKRATVSGGNLPDHGCALGRFAGRRGHHRGRADLFPRLHARPDHRALQLR